MRDIHPDLLDCLRRANPYVEIVAELSAPDVSDVLRRVDQFTGAKRVSVVPANSMATSPRGPLTIASGTVALANFPGEQGSFDLNRENPIRRLKGARFKMDPAFIRAVLRTVTVRVSRDALASSQHDWELQIYRVTRTPGIRQGGDPGTSSYRATAWTEYTHRPLLNPAVVIKGSSVVWDGALKATLAFDLSNHGFVLENTADEAVAADQVAELPSYYFVVKPVNPPKRDSAFEWLTDTATPRVIAGVGTFERVFWARDGEDQQWSEDLKGDVPNIKLDIDQYQASTQVVYALDLTRAPASGTTGRITFERLLPPGTAAALELSTAGAAGPWAAVKHGDAVAIAQQTYHLRLTLNADAALRSSPGATAIGVEFRRAYDVGVESIADLPEREIAMPWLKASIPTGGLDIVRTGARDYLDVATTIGSKESPTKLEAEIFLASRHPSVTRDKWLRLERLLVTDREPLGTHEKFALTSYAARLKRKVPEKKETISSTHTVQAGSTAAAVLVAPPLFGATAGGNEYDGKGYYIRVQSLIDPAATSIPPGHLQTIQGNTGTGQLDFVPALPAALVAGDVIEVHSGIYQTEAVTWVDADPADVWWELWTSLVGFPPERIGLGTLPRGGRPPTLTDRAPGDVATQNKLRITGRLSEEESAYEIADQLDFIMGGATVEIDGQICFVQIYALRDAAGVVTVPLPPVSAVLDPRDYGSPKFPPGIERRATVLTAKYGKNSAASNPDAYPERITTVVDNDAFAWLAKPEIEDLGIVELPDSISRWLYNTTDSGLYLATSLAKMLVNATATGLRVFTLPLVEAHPELMPGDTVVIVTDAYTDYDPATQTELRGWLAIRGVVIGGDSMGRELKVFVAGLADNVVSLAGGAAADLTGLGATPDIPTVGISFNADGTANIDSASPQATSHRIAFSSVSQATADAAVPTATIVSGNPAYAVTGSAFAPGAAIYVAAIAVGATGLESAIGRGSAIREGVGKATAPRVFLEPVMVSRSQISETVRVTGYAGAGGADPLQYRYRIDDGAWSVWAALGASGSSVDLAVAKAKFYDKVLGVQVRDAGGVESDVATWTVIGEYELVAPGTGRQKPTVPMDTTGALPFGRGYDAATDVVETAAQKFTHGNMLDGSRNVVSVFRTAAIEPVGNLFKRGTDTGADVVETAGRNFINGPMLDASRNVVNVYRSAANEPVTNLFKRGSDTAGDIVATAARTFIEPNFVDASFRPVSVYRGAVSEPVGNLFKRGADTASDIVEVAGRNFIDGGMIDASRRVVNVYRTAVTESVGNLFKRGTDTAADVLTTSARSYVDPALVDPSFRVTSVYRGGVNEPVNNLLKAGDSIPPSSFSAGFVDVVLTFRAFPVLLGNTDTFAGMGRLALTDSNANANSRNWAIWNGGSGHGNLTFAHSAAKDGTAVDGTAVIRVVMTTTGGTLYGAWTIGSNAVQAVTIRTYTNYRIVFSGGDAIDSYSSEAGAAGHLHFQYNTLGGATFWGDLSFRGANGVFWKNTGGTNKWEAYIINTNDLSFWGFSGGQENLRLLGAGGGKMYGNWGVTGALDVDGTANFDGQIDANAAAYFRHTTMQRALSGITARNIACVVVSTAAPTGSDTAPEGTIWLVVP